MKEFETLFNRTFRVTESVRWIVFVVALCGLVSTSAQYLWERRREYKTSNVIGVSTSTLANSVAIESAAVFGAAAIVGVVAGTGIGWCLSEYVNPLVFGWGLTFKFNLKPLVEALVFCVGGVAFTRIVAKLLIKRIYQHTSLADE
jgi:predicted lysophospholipase L1 biosynthesis ABC-type transport system permease subunit